MTWFEMIFIFILFIYLFILCIYLFIYFLQSPVKIDHKSKWSLMFDYYIFSLWYYHGRGIRFTLNTWRVFPACICIIVIRNVPSPVGVGSKEITKVHIYELRHIFFRLSYNKHICCRYHHNATASASCVKETHP